MELFIVPSFCFDMICIVLFFLFCARYARLGFLAAVVQICGTVLSLVGAYLFATFADTPMYELFFERALTEQVEGMLAETGASGAEALSDAFAGILPESLWELLQVETFSAFALDLTGDVSAMAQVVMENIVAPITTQMIFMVLFSVGFFACRFLIYLLVRMLKVVNHVPVLGGINRFLGWVVGIAGGCIDIFLAFCALWVLILFTDNALPFLNTIDLAESYFFTLFQTYNPLF